MLMKFEKFSLVDFFSFLKSEKEIVGRAENCHGASNFCMAFYVQLVLLEQAAQATKKFRIPVCLDIRRVNK